MAGLTGNDLQPLRSEICFIAVLMHVCGLPSMYLWSISSLRMSPLYTTFSWDNATRCRAMHRESLFSSMANVSFVIILFVSWLSGEKKLTFGETLVSSNEKLHLTTQMQQVTNVMTWIYLGLLRGQYSAPNQEQKSARISNSCQQSYNLSEGRWGSLEVKAFACHLKTWGRFTKDTM